MAKATKPEGDRPSTMKIVLIKSYSCSAGYYPAGTVAELPLDLAESLISEYAAKESV